MIPMSSGTAVAILPVARCPGYAIRLMKSMFGLEFGEMVARAGGMLDLVLSLLPCEIKRGLSELGDQKFEIYREWGIIF